MEAARIAVPNCEPESFQRVCIRFSYRFRYSFIFTYRRGLARSDATPALSRVSNRVDHAPAVRKAQHIVESRRGVTTDSGISTVAPSVVHRRPALSSIRAKPAAHAACRWSARPSLARLCARRGRGASGGVRAAQQAAQPQCGTATPTPRGLRSSALEVRRRQHPAASGGVNHKGSNPP